MENRQFSSVQMEHGEREEHAERSGRASRAGANVEQFGSFMLAGTELALPVASLQEVVNYPASVTPVPLAPSHLIGLFNLRGTLIPVVDPRPLLRLPEDNATRSVSKIAIVELDEARVGLLFDSTGEIVRVPAEQRIAIEPADDHAPVICGVLKLDGGDRILQVLSAAALLGLPDVPHLQQRAARNERRAQQAQRHQTVSFRVAGAHLALPINAIQEIIRVPALHPSPLADAVCVGMLNLRGMTVPVIDFARFLDLSTRNAAIYTEAAHADERRIIVLKQADAHFGLLVDEVRSIVGYRDDELMQMPAYSRRHVALYTGCIGGEGRENMILLGPEALVADPRISAIANGHRDLYRHAAGGGAGARERNRGVRETYVTFRLGNLLGVRIAQLREVIDYCDDITPTPGSPGFVLGVLTLRRELVTVIDVRSMCGMPVCDDLSHAKVLIVEHCEEKFGLVVDAVDNIVTIDSADRIPVPLILRQQAGGGLSYCMKEAVELPGRGTLMLIDVSVLCERAAAEGEVVV